MLRGRDSEGQETSNGSPASTKSLSRQSHPTQVPPCSALDPLKHLVIFSIEHNHLSLS